MDLQLNIHHRVIFVERGKSFCWLIKYCPGRPDNSLLCLPEEVTGMSNMVCKNKSDCIYSLDDVIPAAEMFYTEVLGRNKHASDAAL